MILTASGASLVTPVHELKIHRECPFLQTRDSINEVIQALPFDARIVGFIDRGQAEMKIQFTAATLGPYPKFFVVVAGPATLREVSSGYAPKI